MARHSKESQEEKIGKLAMLRAKMKRGETLTNEERAAMGGLARAANLSHERMSEIGRMGLLAAAESLTDGQVGTKKKIECEPTGYMGETCGKVLVPGGYESACYGVREAEDLITSHNPRSWRVDPRYPPAVQERDYTGDKAEQLKVERISKKPNPELLLSNSPTAVDGPPVVSSKGYVLGGNGRTMGLKLAYERETADDYKQECVKRASLFGLKAQEVKEFKQPIIVRVVAGLDDRSGSDLAAMSSKLNEGLTQGKGEQAAAVAAGRRLSAETMEFLGASLSEHETLAKAMDADGTKFVARLRADGLITDQNASGLVESDGSGLTSAGRALLEAAYLGRVAGTAQRISSASASTLAKIERVAPYLLKVEARKNGCDAIPAFQKAMDAIRAAKAAKMTLEMLAAQGGSGLTSQGIEAAMILELPARKLSDAMKAWAKLADFDPKQWSLFGSNATPEQCWKALLKAAELNHVEVGQGLPGFDKPAEEKKPEAAEKTKAAQEEEEDDGEETPGDRFLKLAKEAGSSDRFGVDLVYLMALKKGFKGSESEWKQQILAAKESGEISLLHGTYVQAMDRKRYDASNVDGFHFVRDPAALN